MPTTRIMTTVLPHSVDPNAKFHLSLFFSHRLDGNGQLSGYEPMINWVKTLKNALANAPIRLHTDASANAIPCTPLLQATSETAWLTTFPATTEIRNYPKPQVTNNDWITFPAHLMPEHALTVHYTSALSSPVSRPSVIGSCLADRVGRALNGVDGASRLIEDLTGYRTAKERWLTNLDSSRKVAADQALNPLKPQPEDPSTHPGFAPNAAAVERPKSPIELLLERDGVDGEITRYLDSLLRPGAPTVTDPMLAILRDTHSTRGYYLREEERPTNPDLDAIAERTARPAPDFHERAATACNVPALARTLGFVVDVKVINQADLALLKQAHEVWCDVTIDSDDTEMYLSPITLCDGERFLADPADKTRWAAGRMRIGKDDRYRVMDLDPDAAGLALEQHLRSTIRAMAIAVNGDRGSYAPAALRATGFAVAEIDRSDRLKPQIKDSESKLEPVVVTPGTTQHRESFHFENLLRGTRVEVWDDVTRNWHSLHERTVAASFKNGASETSVMPSISDPGMLQNPPLSRTPGDASHPYYVHEVLAGWDGWSLSVPRPGKLVIHNATGPDKGAERITDEAEEVDGLRVRSDIVPRSLPALRYGRKYAFRIAGVDLAGNFVPMDSTAPQDVLPSLVAAATKHLDDLSAAAAAREKAGLLESLRAGGELAPAEPTGDTTRADAERATTSVIKHASSLTMHPEWNVDPRLLAQLSADAEDPQTVTAPKSFLRWDPIPAPTLVPRVAYTAGESLQRMVIRTGLTGQPGLCQRHIVPPKGSELEAEQDGRLDELMRTGNHVRAYAIALKERGNLFHTRIQDLNNPNGSIPQPGVALLSMPGATGGKTLDEIQNPLVPPAEGQYIVHNVDQMMSPYLPDPMAHGIALVFYEAGADHQFSNPRVLQSVFVPYTGTWPEVQPLRLVLHEAPRLDAQQEGNVINIGLPPGEQVAVKFSTTLDAEHLEKMGLWVHHPVHDQNVPEADRKVLADAARNGWLWWLTPDEDLRLVHATARPAVPPKISRLTAKYRNPGVVPASLDGVLNVHGASTDKVALRAQWTEPIDDPNADAPTERTTAEVVADYRIEESERFSLLTIDPPEVLDPPEPHPANQVGSRKVIEPIRPALHTLPDTKARHVKYRLHGSSRYREFFAPTELPPIDDAASAGNEVEVNIPSSAAPAPPVVHDVIPMFLWEATTEPEHPFAVRRVRRSGVRIWLDRPWYSSGGGEMLAVITTGDPNLPGIRPETVSVWARDPILVGPAMRYSYEVPVLPAWQQRAVQLKLAPESLPARPVLHVTKEGPADPANPDNRDKVVDAYAYVPEFDTARKRWFVDVVLDSTSAVWPFLRLALARYQPNSIPDAEFSAVVTTDFVQLPPERIGTLSRSDAEDVRISLTGVTAVTQAPDVQLPAQPPDRADLLALLPKSRRVVATLQVRNAVSGSDIDWVTVTDAQCELAGVDATTFKATWTAALPLKPPDPLITPATDDDLRVQIEEYEILSADPAPSATGVSATQRLVYADHFYL
jgi:hypothetical protein